MSFFISHSLIISLTPYDIGLILISVSNKSNELKSFFLVSIENCPLTLIFKNGNTTGFQFLSYNGACQSIEFDAGVTTTYMELIGGTKEVHIIDRNSAGSVTIEAPTIAQKDYFSAALSDTSLGNLAFTHGSDAGNIVQFTSSKIDIGDVAYSEQNGIVMAEIPITACPSTSGNDEFSLIYR